MTFVWNFCAVVLVAPVTYEEGLSDGNQVCVVGAGLMVYGSRVDGRPAYGLPFAENEMFRELGGGTC